MAAVERVATHVAAAHEMTLVFEHMAGYPVTVNDAGVAAQVLETAAALLGERATALMPAPLMGAEDFSYVLQRVPGAMAFLGACPPGVEPATAPANHSNLVVLRRGAAAGRGRALRPDGPAGPRRLSLRPVGRRRRRRSPRTG